MGLSDEDVREILRIIDESPLEELRVETDGFSLYVRKGASVEAAATPPAEAGRPAPVAPPAESARPAEASEADDRLVTIPSPMLGTFYRAESPGSPPFVEVGARVEPDTTVAIIEVMKMMNSVPAGVSGTVVEVCSENAGLVEYGEPLFRVRLGAAK
jgi:acetyl-CoA carboxylase biotin carboxyl carrier protein